MVDFIHGSLGQAFGFHCDKWSKDQNEGSPFCSYTLQNITNIASWIPVVSMIVGLGRIIIVSVDRYRTSDQERKNKDTALIMRSVIELAPVGFAGLIIADICFTIARARNPDPSAS